MPDRDDLEAVVEEMRERAEASSSWARKVRIRVWAACLEEARITSWALPADVEPSVEAVEAAHIAYFAGEGYVSPMSAALRAAYAVDRPASPAPIWEPGDG